MYKKGLALCLLCLVSILACVPKESIKISPQERDALLKEKVEQQLKVFAKDEMKRQQLNASIAISARRCLSCHASEGDKANRACPNLAGQNPVYLAQQLQHFSDGRRKDFMMSTMAGPLSDDGKAILAVYFAGMPTRTAGGGTLDQQAKGKMVFVSRCAACHGADGYGKEIFPRLAGQKISYTAMMLREFRNPNSRRPNPIMLPIATALSEDEIQAVAAYIANMQ
ncbi:hypothetical protein MNBD_GAMMA26-1842 [hydrothermal vent metagenome]|uniref:Cytochrome c domain-containing protein n=1 Tax=hydrothermal vent metagenome TaxID=652676 RepID=A0A3B1BGT3_9ZZZZ